MFVDTRLHVSVRPSLEYKLPDAACTVRGVLLGDGKRDDAIAALHACLPDRAPAASSPPDDDGLGNVFGEDAIHRLCARVCSHAHDYLTQLSSEWSAHLRSTHLAVRRVTRGIGRRRDDAVAVRARYRPRAPRMVDEEYRVELARLDGELDEALETLRATTTPAVERPAVLVEATHQLKEALANAYGVVATSRIAQIKATFEADMARMQHEVADDFVKQVLPLLP